MSSTNRGSERDKDDKYLTSPETALLICKALRNDGWITNPANLLEPGCGEGSFMDAMAQVWPDAEVVGVDVNPDLVEICQDRGHVLSFTCDYLDQKSRAEAGYALSLEPVRDLPDFSGIIGNPPFKHAEAFIRTSLDLANSHGCVAMLERLNFMGTKKRWNGFWNTPTIQETLAHIYVLPNRLGFTADGGTDSIEYGMFVWKKDHDGPTTLSLLDNFGIENKWRGALLERRLTT